MYYRQCETGELGNRAFCHVLNGGKRLGAWSLALLN